MKGIIKLVGLLKLVNKVNERAQTTIQTHDAIINWYYDITKNNMMTTRLKQP